MEKGVLLIAGGHPYYGRMAANLAASIRVIDNELPIIIYVDGGSEKHLKSDELALFTEVRQLPKESFTNNGEANYLKAKTRMYELSPFENTLYLDVDMVICPRVNVGKWISELASLTQFTIINEGNIDLKTGNGKIDHKYGFWCDTSKILTAYEKHFNETQGPVKLYQMRSEMVFFSKSPEMKKYFKLVKQIYDNPKMGVEEIGEVTPDEFAFNIASAITGINPHKENYSPIFWDYLHRKYKMIRSQIFEEYKGYSIGGNVTNDNQKALYNDLVSSYYKKLGLGFPFKLTKHNDKKHYLNKRKNM